MNRRDVTVLIVDDQPLYRLGLRSALEEVEDITVLGESNTSEETIALVQTLRPRIALISSSPPAHRGMALARRITQRSSDTAVVILSTEEDAADILDAVRSGVSGYLSKHSELDEILRTLYRIRDGEMPVQDFISAHPEMGRRILEEFQSMVRNPGLQRVAPPLSHRELELLRQLGHGRSNKEIANVLKITPQTVKNHISSILRKLDVNDRTQAVLTGLRYGWISLDDDDDGEARVAAPAFSLLHR